MGAQGRSDDARLDRFGPASPLGPHEADTGEASRAAPASVIRTRSAGAIVKSEAKRARRPLQP